MTPTRRAARATGATGSETRTLSACCARAVKQRLALARSAVVNSSRMTDIYESKRDAVSKSVGIFCASRDDPRA